MKNEFTMKASYYAALVCLEPEEELELFSDILSYAFDGIVPDVFSAPYIGKAFGLIRADIDAGKKDDVDGLCRAILGMQEAEQEMQAKREEIERLTLSLRPLNSEALGEAVKRYIGHDVEGASDEVMEAFSIISNILVLELEC